MCAPNSHFCSTYFVITTTDDGATEQKCDNRSSIAQIKSRFGFGRGGGHKLGPGTGSLHRLFGDDQTAERRGKRRYQTVFVGLVKWLRDDDTDTDTMSTVQIHDHKMQLAEAACLILGYHEVLITESCEF